MSQAVFQLIQSLFDYFGAKQPGTNKQPPLCNTTVGIFVDCIHLQKLKLLE